MYLDHKPEKMREEDFRNPPARFRGAPFWAWNCTLKKENLRKQIRYFKEMGMGGFHMHCRTGMNTEYLSDEFMDMVADCNETAKQNDMLCWLYDEDRYASGFGGGYVTGDIRYRERYLLFTPDRTDMRRTVKRSGRNVHRERNQKAISSWHTRYTWYRDIWMNMRF